VQNFKFNNCRINVFTSMIWQTTSTIIDCISTIFIIDPAYFPKEIKEMERTFSEMGKNKDKYLIFTHSDFDHIAGFNYFRDLPVIAHSNFVKAKEEQQKIIQEIANFDEKYYVTRVGELIYPKPNILISERQTISFKQIEITFIPIPGHTNDQLAIYFPVAKVLVVGDMLSNLEFPFVDYSFSQYQESLKILKKFIAENEVQLLIPGHGKPTMSLTEMERRISNDLRYLEELERMVKEYMTQELRENEIINKLKNFSYRGRKIIGNLQKMQENNLRTIINEIKEIK